jgi:hypothetical protein
MGLACPGARGEGAGQAPRLTATWRIARGGDCTLGREKMTAKRTEKATKPRAAQPVPADAGPDAAHFYDRTHDVSGFEGGETVELESTPAGTRNVTLSIRLSPGELQTLGQRAATAGMKLTTYIRRAALQAEAPPVDDDLLDTAAEVVDLVAALRASVEAAKERRERATSNPARADTATSAGVAS